MIMLPVMAGCVFLVEAGLVVALVLIAILGSNV